VRKTKSEVSGSGLAKLTCYHRDDKSEGAEHRHARVEHGVASRCRPLSSVSSRPVGLLRGPPPEMDHLPPTELSTLVVLGGCFI